MGITVLSPFSGRPVKIRDQDVGRAVRDEENRIFYVLERSSGDGYYSAATRAGGERDERRYDEMVEKQNRTKTTGQAIHQDAVHDAQGKRRSSNRGKMVILLFIILVAVLFYLFGPFSPVDWSSLQDGVDPVPSNDVIVPPGSGQIPDNDDTGQSSDAGDYVTDEPVHFITVYAPDDVTPGNLDEDTPDVMTTASGLQYFVEEKGERNGETAERGTYAAVHYVMRIRRGRTIEDTWVQNNGQPKWFIVGAGHVMAGLDEGVTGMIVGEKRTLIVPKHLQRGLDDRLGRVPKNQKIEVEISLIHAAPGVSVEIITEAEKDTRGRVRQGDTVTVDFAGSIMGSDKPSFDSTAQRGRPLTITLGDKQVISGFEAGLLDMKPGERRIMTIPHYLAYGNDGVDGLIPPKAALRYDVTLQKIERHGMAYEARSVDVTSP